MRASDIPPELTKGATVKGTTTEAVPPRPSRVYRPHSTVLSMEVAARPVPWKVSIRRRGKGPPTNPALAAWQRRVRDEAVVAMAGRPPHAGPFSITAWFGFADDGVRGDLTNLLKAAEDALEGVAFVNDRDATRHQVFLVVNDADRMAIVVTAL